MLRRDFLDFGTVKCPRHNNLHVVFVGVSTSSHERTALSPAHAHQDGSEGALANVGDNGEESAQLPGC